MFASFQGLLADPTAEVQLIGPEQIIPGSSAEVALEMSPAEEMHVYYINPGEMGQAVAIKWHDLPEGITFGTLRFPIPHRVSTGELPTNGYEETTHFFTQLTVSDNVAAGDYPLKATISWLACDHSQCLIGKEELVFNLKVGDKTVFPAADTSAFQKALSLIPVDAGDAWKSKVEKKDAGWLIELTAPEAWSDADKVNDVFSETEDFFKPGALPEISSNSEMLTISIAASEYVKDKKTADVVLAGPNPPLRLSVKLPEN